MNYSPKDDDMAAAWLNERDVGTLDDCFMIPANGTGRRSLARLLAKVRADAVSDSAMASIAEENKALRAVVEATREFLASRLEVDAEHVEKLLAKLDNRR